MRERRSLRKRSKRSDDHLSLCVHSRDCSVSVKERVVITKGHGHNTHNSQRTDGERQTMPQLPFTEIIVFVFLCDHPLF